MLRVVARMSLDGGIWKKRGLQETAVLAGFLHPSGFPFFSSFSFLHIISSLIPHTSIPHTILLETPHVLRVTPLFDVD